MYFCVHNRAHVYSIKPSITNSISTVSMSLETSAVGSRLASGFEAESAVRAWLWRFSVALCLDIPNLGCSKLLTP